MRKRAKPTTLSLGTISEGTLRPEDLIPAYLSAAEDLHLSRAERSTVRQVQARLNAVDAGRYNHAQDLEYWESCDADDDIAELAQILEAHCPAYAYFGSLEGDGACFGVWPSIETLEEDARHGSEVQKINAGDPFPPTCRGDYVMAVTDHGNVTLYARQGNYHWREVWSIVLG